MFAGTYSKKIDGSGSLYVPAVFRRSLKDVVYLCKTDNGLKLITADKLCDLYTGGKLSQSDFAEYQPVLINKDGRITLSAYKNKACELRGHYDEILLKFD